MWALYLSQCVDEKWLFLQLQDPDEHVRVWAIRFITDAHAISDTAGWSVVAEKLTSLASNDRSGLVLLYLASALQKMPAEMRWPLAKAISNRPERAFGADRTLSIMLWLGVEPVIAAHPTQSLRLMQQTTFSLVRENIARRLTLEIDHDTETVKKLLAVAAGDPKLAADILRGVAAALEGRKKPPVPSNWNEVSDRLASFDSGDTSDSVKAIGTAFQDGKIISSLQRTVEDSASRPDTRTRAPPVVTYCPAQRLERRVAWFSKGPEFGLAAIRGLAFYDDPEVPTTILDNYSHLTPEQRAAAINTLSSRVSYAKSLVTALESKRVPPTDISAFQARQIIALGNTSVTDRMRSLG